MVLPPRIVQLWLEIRTKSLFKGVKMGERIDAARGVFSV